MENYDDDLYLCLSSHYIRYYHHVLDCTAEIINILETIATINWIELALAHLKVCTIMGRYKIFIANTILGESSFTLTNITLMYAYLHPQSDIVIPMK